MIRHAFWSGTRRCLALMRALQLEARADDLARIRVDVDRTARPWSEFDQYRLICSAELRARPVAAAGSRTKNCAWRVEPLVQLWADIRAGVSS